MRGEEKKASSFPRKRDAAENPQTLYREYRSERGERCNV